MTERGIPPELPQFASSFKAWAVQIQSPRSLSEALTYGSNVDRWALFTLVVFGRR